MEADISTLQKTGHFYFALTGIRAGMVRNKTSRAGRWSQAAKVPASL